MSKRKTTRKRATTAIAARPLTEAQLETFIHAGPVTKERRQHAEVVKDNDGRKKFYDAEYRIMHEDEGKPE